MLTDQERRELRAMASSASVREEFQRLKALSRLPGDQAVDLDVLMRFLTVMSRFGTQPRSSRPVVPYSRVLL